MHISRLTGTLLPGNTYRCTASGITSTPDVTDLARAAGVKVLTGGGKGHGAEEGNGAEEDGGELHFV